ncbi:hypothetical protein S245_052627, partial [Arachis hypogaea]
FTEEEDVNVDDVTAAFDDSKENLVTERKEKPVSMNAFELISRSQKLNIDSRIQICSGFGFHNAGLVRSPISPTLPQIGSRLCLTWGILWSFPETRNHVLVTSLLMSWSITQIIHYSFFGFKEAFPSWLLWLRRFLHAQLLPRTMTSSSIT